MARILTLDPEQARGVRKVFVWMAKRQYGGVVPGILTILAQDLNFGLPANWIYNYLDSYSHWMPSMGRNTADGIDEALG